MVASPYMAPALLCDFSSYSIQPHSLHSSLTACSLHAPCCCHRAFAQASVTARNLYPFLTHCPVLFSALPLLVIEITLMYCPHIMQPIYHN